MQIQCNLDECTICKLVQFGANRMYVESSRLFTQYNYYYFVICNGIFWCCILVTVKINDRFVGFFETSIFEVFLCVKFVFESKVLPLVYWRKCFVSQLFWNLHSLLNLHYFVQKKHKKTTGKNPSFYLFVKIAKVCRNFTRCNAVVWNSYMHCTALHLPLQKFCAI